MRWLLPVLCLVAAVLSGQAVEAAGGPLLLRVLSFGVLVGAGGVLAAKALRKGDRR